MTARYLNLPSCPHCSKQVQCVIEEDVSMHCVDYTVMCNCIALTTSVAKEALAQGGEPYAIEIADQRWKEAVDKMHTTEVSDSANTKNPGSKEETGASVDRNAVWNAVIKAMASSYQEGVKDAFSDTSLTKEEFEEILRACLSEVPESSDLPSEDHQW